MLIDLKYVHIPNVQAVNIKRNLTLVRFLAVSKLSPEHQSPPKSKMCNEKELAQAPIPEELHVQVIIFRLKQL